MLDSTMLFEPLMSKGQMSGMVLQRITWHMMRRTFNWGYPIFATLFVIIAFLQIKGDSNLAGFERVRLVETFLPLAMALQAAAVFSPEDEPALEIAAACPRPLWWLLAERFGFLALVYSLIGTCLTLLVLNDIPAVLRTSEYAFIALLRWVAPALFLSLTAVWFTMRTRNAALSALLIGFMWAVLAFSSQLFAPGAPELPIIGAVQPYVWPFHAYMQPTFMPDMDDYWLNRFIVSALGTVMGLLSLRRLRHNHVEWIVFADRS